MDQNNVTLLIFAAVITLGMLAIVVLGPGRRPDPRVEAREDAADLMRAQDAQRRAQ
jgi:hypothetical protein